MENITKVSNMLNQANKIFSTLLTYSQCITKWLRCITKCLKKVYIIKIKFEECIAKANKLIIITLKQYCPWISEESCGSIIASTFNLWLSDQGFKFSPWGGIIFLPACLWGQASLIKQVPECFLGDNSSSMTMTTSASECRLVKEIWS